MNTNQLYISPPLSSNPGTHRDISTDIELIELKNSQTFLKNPRDMGTQLEPKKSTRSALPLCVTTPTVHNARVVPMHVPHP